jgi:hypothetical protein
MTAPKRPRPRRRPRRPHAKQVTAHGQLMRPDARWPAAEPALATASTNPADVGLRRRRATSCGSQAVPARRSPRAAKMAMALSDPPSRMCPPPRARRPPPHAVRAKTTAVRATTAVASSATAREALRHTVCAATDVMKRTDEIGKCLRAPQRKRIHCPRCRGGSGAALLVAATTTASACQLSASATRHRKRMHLRRWLADSSSPCVMPRSNWLAWPCT